MGTQRGEISTVLGFLSSGLARRPRGSAGFQEQEQWVQRLQQPRHRGLGPRLRAFPELLPETPAGLQAPALALSSEACGCRGSGSGGFGLPGCSALDLADCVLCSLSVLGCESARNWAFKRPRLSSPKPLLSS